MSRLGPRTRTRLLARATVATGLAALVAVMSSAHADPKPPAPPKETRAYVVAAIGDSLTDYKSHGGGYLRWLEKRCPESRFDNYGRGGKMVNQMRRRFDMDVFGEDQSGTKIAERPAYTDVVVFGGVNDLYSDLTAGRTPKKVAKDLGYMYAKARERGLRVHAISVAPWGGFRKYFNDRRGQATLTLNEWIAEQRKTGTIDGHVDAYSLLSCGKPTHLCPEISKPLRDGLHFGPRGHELLGEALFEAAFKDCR